MVMVLYCNVGMTFADVWYTFIGARDDHAPCAMSHEVVVSKSLIQMTKPNSLTKENDSDFCLGLLGWCSCSEYSDFSMASKSGHIVEAAKSVKMSGSAKVTGKNALHLILIM